MNDGDQKKSGGSLETATPSISLNHAPTVGSTSQKLALFEKYFTQIMSNPMNLLSCPLNCCWFIYYVAQNNSPLFSTPTAPSLVSLFASSRHNSVEKLLDKKAASTTSDEQSQSTTEPSKMTRLASVFNSFYIPHHVMNAGFTLVSETDLVRDLLFVFQGIDGAFIHFIPDPPSSSPHHSSSDSHQGSFKLRSDVKIPKPTREMVQELCLLGWLYRMISCEVEYRVKSSQSTVSDGLYGQALVACIEKELVEYKTLVCFLEGQLDDHIQSQGTFVSQDLSLKRLFVWTRDPLFKLSVLLAILQLTRDKRGGQILTLVYSYATHGDSVLQEYTFKLLGEISLPFYNQVVEFLGQGRISDPYGEFFCSMDYQIELNQSASMGLVETNSKGSKQVNSSSNYWKSKIIFHKDLVPGFMRVDDAKKCFQVGKSVEFLVSALNIPPPLTLKTILSPLSLLVQSSTEEEGQRNQSLVSCMDMISNTVEKAYQCVSPFLVDWFMKKERVVDTFHVLSDFLLLGKGDFCLYLMEQLEDTLEKPAQTIYRHDLVGVLESAIRDCNSMYDSSLLSRLDVCLLESQSELSPVEKGWDVFTLDYRVSDSLDTVFSAASMRIYQKLFSFLWRIKRIGYRLMKGYKSSSASHSSRLLLHKMTHFTSILTQHLFQTLATLQQEFERGLEKVRDLDEVVSFHVLFLRKVCDQVLFASHKSATVFQGILGVLESIGEMESLLRPVDSRSNRSKSFLISKMQGNLEPVDVKEMGEVFSGKVKDFLKVLGEAGYTDVVSKLDFNEALI